MGSGNKRKKTDQTLLRRPKRAVVIEAEGGNGGQQDVASTAADMCVSTFQVEVIKSAFVVKNAKVELVLEGELYACYILGHRIGVLGSKRSQMIANCSSIGIKYSGSIVEEKNTTYARFRRVA